MNNINDVFFLICIHPSNSFMQSSFYTIEEFDDKIIAVKRIQSKLKDNAHHYTMEPSMITVSCEWTLVYASFNFIPKFSV